MGPERSHTVTSRPNSTENWRQLNRRAHQYGRRRWASLRRGLPARWALRPRPTKGQYRDQPRSRPWPHRRRHHRHYPKRRPTPADRSDHNAESSRNCGRVPARAAPTPTPRLAIHLEPRPDRPKSVHKGHLRSCNMHSSDSGSGSCWLGSRIMRRRLVRAAARSSSSSIVRWWSCSLWTVICRCWSASRWLCWVSSSIRSASRGG
jgi:hypothetical protein